MAGLIWNHALALQRRYYRMTGKHISPGRMKKHIARLRMKTQKYAFWKALGSQAVQDVLERQEKAYARFFNKQGGPPRFRKVKKFRSFTLKQAGWKLLDSDQKYGRVRIGKTVYKFVYHRPLRGAIKTVTIKRDAAGRLWVCFSVVEQFEMQQEASTGQSGGFDFGLKQFLTTNAGQAIDMPLFFAGDLPRLRRIQSRVSKKTRGSANRRKGQRHLARRQIRIDDRRRDFHFKLAHALCDDYDMLVFEDLNIDGMKRLWGRKVSDLGFARFMQILQWVASKRGKRIVKFDRWTPTTQVCSRCGQKHRLDLHERSLTCDCGLVIDRDHNAAKNILEAGRRLILSQSEEDPACVGRPAFTAEAHLL